MISRPLLHKERLISDPLECTEILHEDYHAQYHASEDLSEIALISDNRIPWVDESTEMKTFSLSAGRVLGDC